MTQRDDYYLNVQADGEYVEFHILATANEAEALDAAMKARLEVLGYADATTEVDIGGEYRYVLDDATDIAALAGEIIRDGGWS